MLRLTPDSAAPRRRTPCQGRTSTPATSAARPPPPAAPPTGTARSALQGGDGRHRHRGPDALQPDGPEGLDHRDARERLAELPGEQDLAVPRRRAQPRPQVGDRADRGVVVAALEADPPQGGPAPGDP